MNTESNERRGRALTFMLSLGMLAGVLIWAKLRLVTDIPRSALAVPEEVDGQRGDPESVDSVEHDESGLPVENDSANEPMSQSEPDESLDHGSDSLGAQDQGEP
ncbi:MAG: hypothetical protein AB8C13_05195 [Phycisphaerales bacterium]